jgi:acyl-CoA synthetase (AMP-forming)/AMP-acid ligase II
MRAARSPSARLANCSSGALDRRPRFGFFREYLKDPEATSAAWAGGWFTGDLVTRDASGEFRFVDRKKNVIRRGGENISAVEVEGVLAPGRQGGRYHGRAGSGARRRGPRLCSPAEPDRANESLARELTSYCLERLAYFKSPGYVALCERLPLTPTEKIQRAQLKDFGRELLERGACVDLRDMKRRNA